MASNISVPLYKSLTQQVLLCGAPRKIIIINIAVAALFVISFKFPYLLPFNIIVQIASAYVTKHDEQWFDCFHRYMSKKRFYNV